MSGESAKENGEIMTRKVLVKIQGMQVMDGETAPSPELITTGTYTMDEGVHQVVYEEQLSETEQITVNCLTFFDGKVELNKDGEVQILMVFEKGRRSRTLYRTPYGDVFVELHAKDVDIEMQEDGIILRLEYGLTMNEIHKLECTLKVHITYMEE